MCVCVCMYMYMCIYIYIYIYVCVCVYVYIHCTCTCYSCLPEDEPLGLKHVYVEDMVKSYMKFNRGACWWSSLYTHKGIKIA